MQTTSNECECKKPKTNDSNRLIAIPPLLIDLLKEHKAKQAGSKTYVLSQRKTDKMIDPNNFSRMFRQWCEKAHLENASPHSTRHTYCTIALEAGTDTKTLADQLGHKDTRMIERVYAHRRTNALQQQAAALVGAKFTEMISVSA